MKYNSDIFLQQTAGLLDETDGIAALANVSALLKLYMPEANWTGFYLVKDDLTVGPFQGKPACIVIPAGKGVCGTAVAEDAVQLVPDVHAFPGHIACDCASRSEIVLPIHKDGAIWGVLDIDSPYEGRFTPEDQAGLEKVVKILEQVL